MIEAYKKYFSNYANFNGCSSRADYWWVVLCNIIISAAISFVMNMTGVKEIGYLDSLFSLATLVPSIAILVRRLHDINKSGWYALMGLIPLAGPIIVLIYLLTDRVEPNNYGERI